MSTTNLFVELIVIGVGAAVWVVLLIAALFGYDTKWIEHWIGVGAVAVPALSFVYLLGIVTDKIADMVLHKLKVKQKIERSFNPPELYFSARKKCLVQGGYLAQQFEYNRSRQRICRGWIFNSLLSASSVVIFYLATGKYVGMSLGHVFGAVVLFIGTACGCWIAWDKLVETEIARLRDFLVPPPEVSLRVTYGVPPTET